jgi:hypothetical protein
MALRNDSTCAPNITAQESVDALYLFLKEGENNSHLENNRMIEGTQPDAYPDPLTRAQGAGTSEAMWGQEPHEEGAESHTAVQHTNAVWDGFKAGREKFLARNFDGFEPSKTQAKEEVGELFAHGKSGEYESRSPFLRDDSKRNPAVVATVFDKTKRLLEG